MAEIKQSLNPHQKKMGQRAEIAIAQSRHALYVSAPSEVARSLGLQHVKTDSAMLFGAAHVPATHFNYVAGLGLDAPVTQETLDEIEKWYNRINVPFAVSLSPLAQPSELKNWLNTQNYAVEKSTAILILKNNPSELEQQTIEVRPASQRQATIFAQTLIDAFDLPPFMVNWIASTVGKEGWYHYLVWEDQTAIAAAILQIHNGVGHLGWAATLPKYRGRGIHRALITQRIQDAFALKCDFVTIDTTYSANDIENITVRNAERLGFEILYVRDDYCKQQ